MPAIKRYIDWAFTMGAVSVPFEQGSLEVGNDLRTEDLKSGGQLNFDLRQTIGKKPFIKATLLDPSVLSEWTEVKALGTVVSVGAYWRAYESNGGLGSVYKSALLNHGVILPVQLTGSAEKRATLDVVAHATFDTGTGLTIGTSTGTAAAVTKAYYPTSATVGSALGNIKDITVSWTYNLQDDEQLEPGYLFYDEARMEGSVSFRDLADVTAARLEDTTTEAVSVLFTDANNASNTVTVNLGNCHCNATVRGDQATLNMVGLRV